MGYFSVTLHKYLVFADKNLKKSQTMPQWGGYTPSTHHSLNAVGVIAVYTPPCHHLNTHAFGAWAVPLDWN